MKSDRDTFIAIFEKQNLKRIEEKKFDILDVIKEEDISGKMQITLSIAMSNEGKNNYEKYKCAQSALDIVLGRGGDQAIVREDNKYHFYGGRTKEVEKRTKVKARIVSHALEELIKNAKDVIIMGHSNSDIDCMGSAIGIYRLATELNKQAYIVSETYGTSLDLFMKDLKEEEDTKMQL